MKLRGLPWNVTVDDIHTFLSSIVVPQGGVHLMNGANGRPSGLAYVELSTEEDSISAPRVEVDSKEGEKARATPQPIIAQDKIHSAEEAKRRAWRKTFDANADARRTDLP